MKNILKRAVLRAMEEWEAKDIYAVSFLIYANEAYTYNGYENITHFAVSYNRESFLEDDDLYGEDRWNYAYWEQDETPIIDADEETPEIADLFKWYADQGITNIGYEDENEDNWYDENGKFIGKGPVGQYELLNLAAEAACELQKEGYLKNRYGKAIPIIVHGLEYAWYDIEATKKANPNGEADVFLKSLNEWMY